MDKEALEQGSVIHEDVLARVKAKMPDRSEERRVGKECM